MDKIQPEDVARGIENLAKAFIAFKASVLAFKVGSAAYNATNSYRKPCLC